MPVAVQTFAKSTLPQGFGSEGRVRFLKSMDWGFRAQDKTNVEPGIEILPQTSGYFCLIDDPHHNGAGVRAFPGADMSQFTCDHGDGTVTCGHKGARLYWADVAIAPGGKLQFHYIFLRGQQNNPFNAFAQFLAVRPTGEIVRRSSFAQTKDAGPVEHGRFYRWRAHPPIVFAAGFAGTLQWVVTNGQRRARGDPTVHPDTDLHPSGLAIDFISIIA